MLFLVDKESKWKHSLVWVKSQRIKLDKENETAKSDFDVPRDDTRRDTWSSVFLHNSQVQRGQPRLLRGAGLCGVGEVLPLRVCVAAWQVEMMTL